MALFQNKVLIFLSHALLFVIDFANLFLSDILMFEATEKVSFDYKAMLHNKLFWVLLASHLVHIILTTFIKCKSSANDQRIQDAISDQQIELIKKAAEDAKSGKFKKAKELIKMYDKLAKRRNG